MIFIYSEIPAEHIDPASIDLTGLVNTLINNSQPGITRTHARTHTHTHTHTHTRTHTRTHTYESFFWLWALLYPSSWFLLKLNLMYESHNKTSGNVTPWLRHWIVIKRCFKGICDFFHSEFWLFLTILNFRSCNLLFFSLQFLFYFCFNLRQTKKKWLLQFGVYWKFWFLLFLLTFFSVFIFIIKVIEVILFLTEFLAILGLYLARLFCLRIVR